MSDKDPENNLQGMRRPRDLFVQRVIASNCDTGREAEQDAAEGGLHEHTPR